MSHNIIEVDEFTTPVVVPDGTDDHMLLSSYMLAFVQALTNRTKRHELHAAFKNAANTFTLTNQFNDVLTMLASIESQIADGSLATLVQRETADNDAHAGNKYKNWLAGNIGGASGPGSSSGYCIMYTGTGTGTYQFIIAINAAWDTVGQHWSSDNTAVDSVALLFRQSGTVVFSRRPAGSGTWTTWPTAAGDGEIQAATLTATDKVQAPLFHSTADATIDGTCTAGEYETAGNYDYSAGKSRVTHIPLADVYVNSSVTLAKTDGGSIIVATAGDKFTWGFKLPAGAVIHSAQVMVEKVDTSGETVKSYRKHGYLTSTAGAIATPTYTLLHTQTTTVGAININCPVSFDDLVATDLESYEVMLTAGAAGDQIHAVMVVWSDNGLRNI
jgi:hypothetical protein